jgi:hypothetical protein
MNTIHNECDLNWDNLMEGVMSDGDVSEIDTNEFLVDEDANWDLSDSDEELRVFSPVQAAEESESPESEPSDYDSDATESAASSEESEYSDEEGDTPWPTMSTCAQCGDSYVTCEMINFDTDLPLYCSDDCVQLKKRHDDESKQAEIEESRPDVVQHRTWRRTITKKRSASECIEPRKRMKCNPEGFDCPLNCGRSFKKRKNIFSHLMGPSGHNGAKSYSDECEFKQKGWIPNDYEHYPFKCSVYGCGFERGERRQLRAHYEKKHPQIDASVLHGHLPNRGELILQGDLLVCLDNGNGFAVYY